MAGEGVGIGGGLSRVSTMSQGAVDRAMVASSHSSKPRKLVSYISEIYIFIYNIIDIKYKI